tara:strand:- start:2155 stop:2376 length:222 start_codon:yes stop_codon:yes gene_type:complete
LNLFIEEAKDGVSETFLMSIESQEPECCHGCSKSGASNQNLNGLSFILISSEPAGEASEKEDTLINIYHSSGS